MQSVLCVVLASLAFCCKGYSVSDGRLGQYLDAQGPESLASLLLAFNVPAAKRGYVERSLGPQLQDRLEEVRRGGGPPEDGRGPPPDGRTVGKVVPLGNAAPPSELDPDYDFEERQAVARRSIEEAARVTEENAARARDLAFKMEQASARRTQEQFLPSDTIDPAVKELVPQSDDIEEEITEEITAAVEVMDDGNLDMQPEEELPLALEGKSLPQILSEEVSFPSVDARTARILLPILGIATLAGGSAYYGEPKVAEVAPPAPAKPVDIAPPPVAKAPVAKPPVVAPPVVAPPAPAPAAVSEKVVAAAIDTAAMDAAMKKFFPGALDSPSMDSKVANVLSKRGYTGANTLLASSLCPDEVNAEKGDLLELMKDRWGENFALGGLAGLPFVGKAGFSAYAHHVPDSGKLLVLFAPHVGVDFDGKVGKLKRFNQQGLSTACGAAIGAYNGIIKQALSQNNGANGLAQMKKSPKSRNDFDGQIEYIMAKLEPKLRGIEKAPDEIAFVSYQMYDIVREFLIDQVLTASDVWRGASEICVVGGIMVNRGDDDKFVPLFFQAREGKDGDVVDLYKEAFGEKPDLSYILGDEKKAASFYNYDLSTLSVTKEAKLFKLFPGAQDSASMDSKVAKTLNKYGYTSDNTLFATSTCPDEVNAKQGEMIELMKARWGENFALGGLAGLPFVGKSGFGAYVHHVPDNGKLFIVFAPHVGIDFDGKVGALKRLSQKGVSTACGASIGAYNAIIKEALENKEPGKGTTGSKTGDAFDAQISYIKTKLKSRMKGIDTAPDPIAFVTYQMYAITREFIDEVLAATNLFEDAGEVCLLGGIMINGDAGDHFMPLLFESKRGKDGDINDLFGETFGYRPDLSYPLGDGAKASNYYKTDLKALS